jgi:hypothetical protein
MTPLQKIREALEFYGNESLWDSNTATADPDSVQVDWFREENGGKTAREALALLDTLKPLSEGELTRMALEHGEQCPACAEETLWSSWFEGYRAAEKRLLGEHET